MKFDYYKKRQIIVKNEDLLQAIARLAKQINRDYKNKEVIIVALLNASIVFLAKLLMQLTINVEIMPVKASTYHELGEQKSGEYYVSSDFKWSKLKGQNILFLDDMIDTGDTLNFICNEARKYEPESIKTIVLCEKDFERKINFIPDYIGIKVPNVWITGFGMDYNHKFRNLNDIVHLSEEEKQSINEIF